ncbi:MAG: acyl carrier protein [Flavobacteriaceae bacterium]|nr:acyl carrier protein [Flavobacteriaceae bacterium]
MNVETILEKLRGIFASELGLEKAEVDGTLQYSMIPEWDSVGHMHLVAAIEEVFSIEIPDNDVAEMTTFNNVVDTVSRLVGDG